MGAQALAEEMPFVLAIDIGEWYFASWSKSKPGGGMAGELQVFGMFKRGARL